MRNPGFVCIFHFGRSGSTVLSKELSRYYPCYGEVITLAQQRGDRRAPVDILEDFLSVYPEGGFFELKAINFAPTDLNAYQAKLAAVKRLFSAYNVRVAILERENALARALSAVKAADDGVYHVHDEVQAEQKSRRRISLSIDDFCDYDTGLVHIELKEFLKNVKSRERVLLRPLERFCVTRLSYEDSVKADPAKAAKWLLDDLGYPLKLDVSAGTVVIPRINPPILDSVENRQELIDYVTEHGGPAVLRGLV